MSTTIDSQNENLTRPQVDYTQEVRFAIVMYGGLSLAVYINGVAQELLHLVRSAAPQVRPDDSVANPSARYADEELTGSEKVYRKLAQMMVRGRAPLAVPKEDEKTKSPDIRTRFIVDILSGSSAGGINAVFLAKALANDQPLQNLEKLWVTEGDMAVLINDKESLKDTALRLQDPPKSLLNSQRIYWDLLDALEGMEPAGKTDGAGSTNVDELDLFVTATDLNGQTIKLQLSDEMVQERRHRKVFHFIYDCGLDPVTCKPRNDFEEINNPFLAFAARTTSAHPAAFEPMNLGGIDDILNRHEKYKDRFDIRSDYADWEKFYEEYLQPEDSVPQPTGANSDKTHKALVERFKKRPFNDGGVLDNQPFSPTIETLPKHRPTLPTVRKLLYIEPAPEKIKADPEQPTPDFVETAWLSLSTLPRYEPIREHLEHVLQRNQLVERVQHLTEGMEKDIERMGRPHVLTRDEFNSFDLERMISLPGRGLAWASYQRLRVAEVTDELVLLIARTRGFDEDSDESRAVRQIVRHWRMQHYLDYLKQKREFTNEPSPDEATETRFLTDFDIQWRLRRLRFVMRKIDDLACFDLNGKKTRDVALKKPDQEIPYPQNDPDDQVNRQRLRQVLLKIKKAFRESYKTLMCNRNQLWSPVAETTTAGEQAPDTVANIRAAIEMIGITRDELSALLQRLTDTERNRQLDEILDKNQAGFKKLQTDLSDLLRKWFSESRTIFEQGLDREGSFPSDERAIRDAIAFYFDYFDFYDMIAHPILYATDAGDELDYIEVYRVSPQDATALVNEKTDKKQKLAGTKLADFGAFFKTEFRANDILWGRLDGAERIITALLPDQSDEDKRVELIKEAHNAIIKEVLGVKDESQLIDVLKQLAECAEVVPAPVSDSAKKVAPQRKFNKTAEQNLSNVLTDARIKFALDTFLGGQTPAAHFTTEFKDDENFKRARQFNTQDVVTDAARASKVFGKMLEGYVKLHQVDNKRVVWVTRLAQLFWGLVQVAIPGSIANLVFHHWLKLLYLFEFLLILLGTLLTSQPAQQFGWICFGITVAVHAAQLIVTDSLVGKHWIRNLVVALLAVALVFLAVLGAITILALPGYGGLWNSLSGVHELLAQPASFGWNTTTLVKAILLVLVGGFLARALWRDTNDRMRTRLLGILPLLLGLGITVGLIQAYYVTSQSGHLLPGGFHLPGLAIEMVRQPSEALEIEQIFPIPKLRKQVTADFGFIVLYTASFLSFSYWIFKRRFKGSSILAVITVATALATAGFDVLENLRLYTIFDAAQNPRDWMIHNLHIATVLKWSFCFITVGLLSPLFLTRRDILVAAGVGLLVVAGLGLASLFTFVPALEIAFGVLGALLLVIGFFITVWPERFLAPAG